MIKAIIFDCFGVIYPDTLTMVQHTYLKNDIAKQQKIREVRKVCDRGEMSRDDFWDEVARIFNIPRAELDVELDKVRGADWELLEYIKDLKKNYKTAILSNVGAGFIERIFDHDRKQQDYFDVLAVSGQIGTLKPDPKAYLYTADKLGIEPSDCVFIDDKKRMVEGAEQVGMQGIVYTSFDDFKNGLEVLLSKKG